MTRIIKRNGTDEHFDVRKIYASIYASMLASHESVATAEYTADEVSKHIDVWSKQHTDITSHDIRAVAHKKLLEHNERAAYVYLHHRVLF
jgi:transcriptional regulator NrdR family protein